MAQLPVSRLLRPLTRAEILQDLIILGDALKLRASSWRGPARWTLIALAELGSRLSVQVSAIASQGYQDTASGMALTRRSRSTFSNDRLGSVRARGRVLLSDAGGVGPLTIPAGSRAFIPTETPHLRWRSVSSVEIPLNAEDVEVTIEAEVGGTRHNAVPVDTTWELAPVLAGIEVTNPAPDGEDDWITTPGVEEEEDPVLRQRNRDKWSTLGGNSPRAAYDYWARSSTFADTGEPVGITRARTEADPPGDGTLTVYVAAESGTATPEQVEAAQSYIDARHPPTAAPTVEAAEVNSFSIEVDVLAISGSTVTEEEIEEVIDQYIDSLPIGGIDHGGVYGVVPRGDLEFLIKELAPEQILKVEVTSPASDSELLENQIAINGSHTVNLSNP